MLTLSLDSLTGLMKSTVYFLHPNTEDANEELIYLVANSFRTCLYAFGFWLLTMKTSRLSSKLIRIDSDTTTFLVGKTGILQVLFCIAGIVITFFAISACWSQLTMVVTWDYNGLPEKHRTAIYLMQIGVPVTKGLLGLAFIFFSWGLARLLTSVKKKEE